MPGWCDVQHHHHKMYYQYLGPSSIMVAISKVRSCSAHVTYSAVTSHCKHELNRERKARF